MLVSVLPHGLTNGTCTTHDGQQTGPNRAASKFQIFPKTNEIGSSAGGDLHVINTAAVYTP